MRNVLIRVSYDGTDFHGWQRQDGAHGGKGERAVQGCLEDALLRLHGRHVHAQGSGRTDSGVHARSQAASFFSPIDSIPIQKYPAAINSFLPRDIRVNGALEVPADFSARFSATSRVYRYFLVAGGPPLAAQSRFSWSVGREPSVKALDEMAGVLRGEMDCASLAASGDKSASTCRFIDGARFFESEDFLGGRAIVFEIEANAFLWNMVRTTVGTLLALEKKGEGPDALKKILAARDRRAAGPTAPARGLFLWDVKFDGERRHP